MDEYVIAKHSFNSTQNPIAKFMINDFRKDLENSLAANISVETAVGVGYLAINPSVKFIDNSLDKQKFRLNLMYYFKSDMGGLYLTLKIPYNRNLKKKYGNYYSSYLRNKSEYVKQFLERNNKLKDDLVFEMDLPSTRIRQRLHSKATIVAKFYDKDNIPSTEELISDINYFLDLRKFIYENYTDQTEISVDEWVKVLENNLILDSKMLNILEIMYNMEGYKATINQLVEKREELGFVDEKSYNSTIVANSRRVKEFLNKKAFYNKDGSENFWMRFFYGEDVKTRKNGKKVKIFQFRLKDELVEALAKFDIRFSEDEIIGEEKVGEIVEEKLFDSFHDYLLYNGYFFDKETIENYLLSLKIKPFAILTGNSGTGKTKLSQLFAQYLLGNREIIIGEEYLSVNVPITNNLKKDSLQFTKKVVREILDLYQYEGKLDVSFNGIKSKESIGMYIIVECRDKKILDYLNTNDFSEIEIKIKKQDIQDSFVEIRPQSSKFSFERNLGINYEWTMPKEVWSQFIPLKSSYDWNIVIGGINSTARLTVLDVRIGAINTKNEELKNYFNETDYNASLNIEFDLSTLEPIKSKEDFQVISEKYSPHKENYKIIPVGANWTENRNIVGYYNVITNKYQSTPAYDLITQAQKSDEPHFLILDEMNLSHVERYFADFLSAIESKEKIPLYGEEALEIPDNLFIIGTVNVDETTYMFSPKVLDRANVLEFKTYSAASYMNGDIKLSCPDGNLSYLENPLDGNNIRSKGIDELRELFDGVKVENEPFWNILSSEIEKFQSVLKVSGFDFGFRVINEIVRFMAVAWEYENKPDEFSNWERYFDAQIKQKMLPKLHGSEKIIGDTIDELHKICLDSSIDDVGMAKYPESYKKLTEMKKVLQKQRYVSFIN